MKAASINPTHKTRPVDLSVVNQMMAQVCGQTDETLNRQFGISYNTWRKIRAGAAIRRSVADRLEQRIRGDIDVTTMPSAMALARHGDHRPTNNGNLCSDSDARPSR